KQWCRLARRIAPARRRKSFLRSAIGDRPPAEREWGTAAAVTASVMLGAHIVRVHGVRAMRDVVRTADLIVGARAGSWQSRCSDTEEPRRLQMGHMSQHTPD